MSTPLWQLPSPLCQLLPDMLESAGAAYFENQQATKLGREEAGGGGLLSATLNMKKHTQKIRGTCMITSLMVYLANCTADYYFFPPPILLSLDCFTFLSLKSPDVLSPGSRPNNEGEEGGVSASQDRRHDCIFHMGSALRDLQPFFLSLQ